MSGKDLAPLNLEHTSLAAIAPGTDPRQIVAQVFYDPFSINNTIDETELVPDKVKPKKGGGSIHEYPLPPAVSVVVKVTPEQLLGVVAALIATSKTASEAVARIRAEVAGWTFKDSAGADI